MHRIRGAGLVALLFPSLANADPVFLGADAGYAVFAYDDLQLSGPSAIPGNVAIENSYQFANTAVINGQVVLNTGIPNPSGLGNPFQSHPVGAVPGSDVPTGGFATTSLSQPISAAEIAARVASGLTATQRLGSIGAQTITGNANLNVIDVSSINLTNGLLTLSGSATSRFVINDTGNFNLLNSGIQLTGGLTASNVLWNVGGNVSIGSAQESSNIYGTILAPNSRVTLQNQVLTGELIGLHIDDATGPLSAPPTVPVPAPLWGALVILGGLAAWKHRRGIGLATAVMPSLMLISPYVHKYNPINKIEHDFFLACHGKYKLNTPLGKFEWLVWGRGLNGTAGLFESRIIRTNRLCCREAVKLMRRTYVLSKAVCAPWWGRRVLLACLQNARASEILR